MLFLLLLTCALVDKNDKYNKDLIESSITTKEMKMKFKSILITTALLLGFFTSPVFALRDGDDKIAELQEQIRQIKIAQKERIDNQWEVNTYEEARSVFYRELNKVLTYEVFSDERFAPHNANDLWEADLPEYFANNKNSRDHYTATLFINLIKSKLISDAGLAGYNLVKAENVPMEGHEQYDENKHTANASRWLIVDFIDEKDRREELLLEYEKIQLEMINNIKNIIPTTDLSKMRFTNKKSSTNNRMKKFIKNESGQFEYFLSFRLPNLEKKYDKD